MFPCPICKGPMDVEETSNDPTVKNCRRERHCKPCDFTVMTTEVSDGAYHAAVKRRAMELAREMVADIRDLLGVHVPENSTCTNFRDSGTRRGQR